MTSKWTVLLVLGVAAVAFAAGRHSIRGTRDFDPARDLQLSRLAPLLGLSEAQAAEVRDLEPAYVGAVSNACDAHCASRCELAHCLAGESFNADQARDLVTRMCEAHRANELATMDYITRLRSVLTPEQRGQFLNLIGQCLCTTCARGENSCCESTPHMKEHGP